jgi:Domain of unknown function (DUF397)
VSAKITLTDEERGRLAWRKATMSTNNGACVEVASVAGEAVAVRDSKDPGGHVLVYTLSEWSAFINGARNGEFDDLAL